MFVGENKIHFFTKGAAFFLAVRYCWWAPGQLGIHVSGLMITEKSDS
jgi:hypothetical protein